MFNLLITTDKVQNHYFFRQNKGIFLNQKDSGCFWSGAKCIIENTSGPFWVYADSTDSVNIVFTDNENNLTFGLLRPDGLKTYILTKLNPDIMIDTIRIFPVSDRLNLMYSAMYKDEIILVHCILGDRAMPQTVNKMNSPHFWIYNNAVYYTKQDAVLVYTDFSDEKPMGFNPLNNFGENVSMYNVAGKDFLLYTHDNRLYINNSDTIYDSRMEMPALMTSANAIYVMWKSGGYVRYMISLNNGDTWSAPMRFMASGAEIQRYYAQHLGNDLMFYGYNTSRDLHLFAKPDMF